MAFLITEENQDVQYLIEEDRKTGKKEHFIQGRFMVSEEKNKNGRIYPRHILEREAARYNRDYISKGRALGELGHPENPSINLDRVSHIITELRQDGNNFIGKAKILDTPNGRIVKSLLEGGVKIGVSTRGVGSLQQKNGYSQVGEDYHLATAADIVHDPSGPECFVQGIMEGASWLYDEATGEWHMRQLDRAKKMITEASRFELEDVALKVFDNFIRRL